MRWSKVCCWGWKHLQCRLLSVPFYFGVRVVGSAELLRSDAHNCLHIRTFLMLPENVTSLYPQETGRKPTGNADWKENFQSLCFSHYFVITDFFISGVASTFLSLQSVRKAGFSLPRLSVFERIKRIFTNPTLSVGQSKLSHWLFPTYATSYKHIPKSFGDFPHTVVRIPGFCLL